jgi:arylsulfatase A-like enzyme
MALFDSMHSKHILPAWLLCSAVLSWGASSGPPAAAAGALGAERPNVLIILVDDLGYGDLGITGGTHVPTPHMDSIARNGVQFTNSYASGPVCSPSRAALMSGRYQQRFGMDFLADGDAPSDRGPRALDLRETTVAQRMQALGYRTGMFGKWHLADIHTTGQEYMPTARGFDEFYGILTADFPTPGTKTYRGTEVVPAPVDHTQAFTREAVDFIERHRKRPWFLYLPYTAVHSPFVAPAEYLARYEGKGYPVRERNYYAMLHCLDDAIGRVLQSLRDLGLEERTLILFASDNGGPHEGPQSNRPFRSGKFSLWEGGIRSPIFVQWKGRLKGGIQLPHLVNQIDFVPTALAAAGSKADPAARLDGVNLLPVMQDPTRAVPTHEAMFWRFGVQYAIRKGDWKLIKPAVDSPRLLFNLASDPGETANLAAQHPEKVRELDRLWNEWNSGNETPAWFDERWNGIEALEAIRAARRKAQRPTGAQP